MYICLQECSCSSFQKECACRCRINGQWIRRVALPEDEEFSGCGPDPVAGLLSPGSIQQATGAELRLYCITTQTLPASHIFNEWSPFSVTAYIRIVQLERKDFERTDCHLAFC